MLEKIRKNVDPFQENDTRCVYEFLQQTAPLADLPQRRAVEVFTKELLSPELQQGLPKPVFLVDEVRHFLLEKFGNLTIIVEGWVLELEQAAAARRGGTRHRYQALVSALNLVNRVQSLSPEVLEWEVLVILAKPWILCRIQETLQPQDVERC